MKDFSGEESTVKVHAWELHPSTYLHYDEEIRERVRDPPFSRFGPIYRAVRRARLYKRVDRVTQRRNPVPCKGRPLPIRYFDELGRKLKMSRAELETHIDYVKTEHFYITFHVQSTPSLFSLNMASFSQKSSSQERDCTESNPAGVN
jgi:hypothetical protein